MSCDFSDEEDKQLVQLVKASLETNKSIKWDVIAKRMKRKTKEKLQGRLKTLKQHYGLDVHRFPRRFFMPLRRLAKKKERKNVRSILASFNTVMSACDTRSQQLNASRIVNQIFASIPKSVVNQSSEAPQTNVGEVTASGVSRIISSVAPAQGDVFVDFGAGIGNVVAQVALETSTSLCVGVELRLDVVRAGYRLIQANLTYYPLLRKVRYIHADINHVNATTEGIQKATVLYSFNTLFTSETNQSLELLVCSLSLLRTLVLAVKPCSRHRAGCAKAFCLHWKLAHEIEAGVTFKSTDVAFYVYTRNLSSQ